MKKLITIMSIIFSWTTIATTIRMQSDIGQLYSELMQDKNDTEDLIYDSCGRNVSLRILTPTSEGVISIIANTFDNKEPVIINLESHFVETKDKKKAIRGLICTEYFLRATESLKEVMSSVYGNQYEGNGSALTESISPSVSIDSKVIQTSVWVQLPALDTTSESIETINWFRSSLFIGHKYLQDEGRTEAIILGGKSALLEGFWGGADASYFEDPTVQYAALHARIYDVSTEVSYLIESGEFKTDVSVDIANVDFTISSQITKNIALTIRLLTGVGLGIVIVDGEMFSYFKEKLGGSVGISFDNKIFFDIGLYKVIDGNDFASEDSTVQDYLFPLVFNLAAVLTESLGINVEFNHDLNTHENQLTLGATIKYGEKKRD